MESEGWILDAHAGGPDEMVVWLKKSDGGTLRLTDRWNNAVYVAAENKSALEYLSQKKELQPYVSSAGFVMKRENVFDYHEKEVLRFELRQANDSERLARLVEELESSDEYRIYNVDLLPAQVYLMEKDLFPLARVRATQDSGRIEWTLEDSNMDSDYALPPLRRALLSVEVDSRRAIPMFTDPIDRITVAAGQRTVEISEGSETAKLLSMVRAVQEIDPDILFVKEGDEFTTHYLAERAYLNGVSNSLTLGRDSTPLRRMKSRGTSYFAYGRVLHTPTSHQLHGRINLDSENFFVYTDCGLEGLFEVARLCRMPLHKGSRASIGKCLSSLQAYVAFKDNLLVPWKPSRAEVPKTASTLLIGDRGGFIYEPRMGVYEDVGEIDYTSLFPFIMKKYNISAETVLCNCCPDSKRRVPDVDYNICERRVGLIPKSLEPLLTKRLNYKRLKKETQDPLLKKQYEARIAALKGILVCCLTGDTTVLVRRGGETRYTKIGPFIDELVGESEGVIDCPSGIFVAGLDRNLHAKFCEVRKLIKVPKRSEILRFTMDTGRRISTTAEHPFFILDNGELEARAAGTVQQGDLVPVAARIPLIPKRAEFIDLVDSLQEKLNDVERFRWKVCGNIVRQAITDNKHVVKRLSKGEGYCSTAVNYWEKNGMIPLPFFPALGIPSRIHKELRIGIGRTGKKGGGRTSWLPAIIPINEELGFFLGLYVSDGSATNTYVRLDIGASEEDLLASTRRVTESLFHLELRVYKERKPKMHVHQINSLALTRFITQVIGLPGSAEKGKLTVPSLIFNSNRLTARGFLEGVLAGDGTASKTRNTVSIATADKEFANELGYLATVLDLGFRIDIHSRPPERPLYCINFVGPDTLKKIADWRLLKDAQVSVLEPKLNKLCRIDCSHPLYKTFPLFESGLLELAWTTATVKSSGFRQRLSICPTRAGNALQMIEGTKLDGHPSDLSRKVHRLLESDLGFLRVKKIEKLQRSDEFVYCFQIGDEDLPGFFAGEGLVYTHNCFGYLSYRNAKFGLIDCHISVCAYARKILLDTSRIAERRGFEVLHGIVDSLWVKKDRSRREDFQSLCSETESEIGLPISFEGVYRWIAFLPSRMYEDVPVLNRYFGVFEDGEMKTRGIELRRSDTIKLVADCQREILTLFAAAEDIAGVKKLIPAALDIFAAYTHSIWNGDVPISDLVIVNSVSKDWNQYHSNLAHVSAVRQLADEGLELLAGQSVSYIITDYGSKVQKDRVRPVQLLNESTSYDKRRYTELLARGVFSILEPFGVDEDALYQTIGLKRRNEILSS